MNAATSKEATVLHAHFLDYAAPLVGALMVVIAGKMLARRKTEGPPEPARVPAAVGPRAVASEQRS